MVVSLYVSKCSSNFSNFALPMTNSVQIDNVFGTLLHPRPEVNIYFIWKTCRK